MAAALLWYSRPQTAVVHLSLATLNLLPARALDGGQILELCLCMTGWERHAPRILTALSAVVLLPLAVLALYVALSGGNPSLLVVSGYLALLVFFHPE